MVIFGILLLLCRRPGPKKIVLPKVKDLVVHKGARVTRVEQRQPHLPVLLPLEQPQERHPILQVPSGYVLG